MGGGMMVSGLDQWMSMEISHNLVLVHALQTRSREVGLAVMHVMVGQFKTKILLHTQL